MSQLSRGQSRALGQHLPSGVGGMSPPGQSSVRQPMAEQSLTTREPLLRREASTFIITLIFRDNKCNICTSGHWLESGQQPWGWAGAG